MDAQIQLRQDLQELYERGKSAYTEHLNQLEEKAQRAEKEHRKQLAKEQGVIRAVLVERIGSLVEFVDLEGKGFYDFKWNPKRAGSLVTISLPGAAPIQLNIYCEDENVEVTRLDGNKIGGNVRGGNHGIFVVPGSAQIRDDYDGGPYVLWEYDFWNDSRVFADLYLAVGCALANAHLEKEAWERYNQQMKVSFDPGKPESKTWKDTLADAIERAVQEALYE